MWAEQQGPPAASGPAPGGLEPQQVPQQQPARRNPSPVAAAPLPPLGRPPLPRSVPASASSSRASSPGRASLSAQPSLHTLNMNRQAQYKPAARMFKADAAPRKGLSSGDVVAFRAQGKLLLVAELPGADPSDPTAVHHVLQPAAEATTTSDRLVHLEVIRQGKWMGFRAAAAGDRFLQARKRSPNRLVFFSQNVGTWEQWELGGGSPDPEAAEWASLAVTLRHRRLPQFELAVELVRVGSVAQAAPSGAAAAPSGATTPRSLAAGEAAPSASSGSMAGADDDPTLERRELKRMSGVLVHEWLHYVDQEKTARLAIEARVAQLAEDAVGLREWAVMQVESVRNELGAEVQALLDAVARKSAKLADAEARLTGRLRWGVAMIQAKSELGAKRGAFAWWRTYAARQRYCRHVEAKLQQRSALRLQARAFQALLEWREAQQARQAQLRAAVRRMYFVRLYHAFAAWRDLVALKREAAAEAAAVTDAVCQHMQRWRLRRLLQAWQAQAAGCAAGRQALLRMGAQAERRAVADAFGAWRSCVAARQQRLASLSALVDARQRVQCQAGAFAAWRLATEDAHGARLQSRHAAAVLSRLRLRQVLLAWQEAAAERADRRQRWDAITAHMVQRRAMLRLDTAFGAWVEYVEVQREERALFYEAVQHMALRKMAVAFRYWRLLTQRHAHERAVLQASVGRLTKRMLAGAWEAWTLHVAEQKVARHRVAVCQRRHAANLLQGAFAGWRERAAFGAAERQIVSQCQRRADRNRMAVALAAFRANAEEAIARRQRDRAAVGWYAQQLQARAFAALAAAVARRREFEQRLAGVAAAVQQGLVQEAFSGWRASSALSTAETQLVAAAQRRLGRIRLAAAFSGWQQQAAHLTAARQEASARAAAHDAALLADCFAGWQAQAARRAQQQDALVALVARRAAYLQLSVLHGWQAWVEHQRAQRMQLQRAARKLAGVCQRHAFAAWRAAVAERRAQEQWLAVAQRRLAARAARRTLAAAFRAWRSHTATLAAARAAVDAKVAAEGAVVRRHVLAAWQGTTRATAERHDHLLRVCVERRALGLQSKALFVWQLFAQRQAHNREAVEVMVHRMARRVQHAALLSWRQAAQERKVRRTAIARFIQRWDAHRKAAALAHWRRLLQERREAEENLKRCLTRKRVAFRLFRQWYWESFDEDMQETLRAMFEVAEGAALDPLPSRAGSPYGSLLSSPIRQQLYAMPRHQQLQLSAGVAQAFAGAAEQAEGSGALGALPQLPAREPLAARLAAASAAGRAALPGPPSASLGGAPLAPLRDSFAAFTVHSNGLLETVPEVAESPYLARSTPGGASSTASTAVPDAASPLTPASAFAAGRSPLVGSASRWATPGGSALQQLGVGVHVSVSPGGLSAAATPGAGGLGSAARQASVLGSPLGALSEAPTPAAIGLPGGEGPGFVLRSPLSGAGTPAPDFGLSGEGWGGASPLLPADQQLAQAPTPGWDHGYEIRQFSDGTDYLAPANGARLGGPATSEFEGTPLAAQRTPPPGLLELQVDYSIRRMAVAAEEEGKRLAGEATPRAEGLIAAYTPGSRQQAASTGGDGSLSAAKTPLLQHLNPLF